MSNAKPTTTTPRQIRIFDTTLRDGLQSPHINPVPLAGRVAIGEALARLGVDVIEAGFAIASKLDFDTIQTLAQKGLDTTICSLARATEADITAAGEALKVARSGRIHTFISTSPIHMEKKLRMTPEQVLEAAVAAVKLARQFTDDVEFSLEDFTRTDHAFSYQVIEAVIKAGASTVNLPDTVGYATPDEYAELIRGVLTHTPGAAEIVLSTHCHNDLGLAVANSLAGVQAGAGQIECSVNGIGERAGNAAMEELVMAMKVRADRLPYDTRLDTTQFMVTSQLIQELTGMHTQWNKAVVGRNAFAHESGIHQHGIGRDRRTYEIMTPESVGQSVSSLTLGVTSGRDGLRRRMAEFQIELTPEQLNALYLAFMEKAAEGRVDDDALKALAQHIKAS